MFLVRGIIVLALLNIASSSAYPAQLRFHFPNSQLSHLLLGMSDSDGSSGYGHRVPVSGEEVQGGNGGGQEVISSPNTNSGVKGGVSNSQEPREPSKCVWAITSCCQAGSIRVNSECFEKYGCPGSFWDQSPCRRESAAAAYRIMMRYFEQKASIKREEMASMAMQQAAPLPTPDSPFEPIGLLPSREDAELP